jgi:Flp pilus assembly protein TadG
MRLGSRAAQRGQGLLEFALILPLFLLLLFGIIEFAIINVSIGSFNFATQDAARYGAIVGPTDPNSDTTMLTTIIEPRINQIVAAQLVSIEIFKATESGACFGGSGAFPCSTEDSYNAQTQLWTYGWPATVRNDQLIVGDYLGVRITYTYTYITAFFATLSPTITLTAESVQRVEPQEYTKRHTQPAVADASPALPTAREWESASPFARLLDNTSMGWIINHAHEDVKPAQSRAIALADRGGYVGNRSTDLAARTLPPPR